MFRNLRIAPEGYGIITFAFIICVLFNILTIYFPLLFSGSLANIMIFLFVGTCFFFRDPIRNIENQSSDLLSPADGKIVAIEKYQDPEIGESIKIAIFLSILNVHRQWVPLNAKVISTQYNPGAFSWAFMDKSSDKNEQTSILFNDTASSNIFRVKQIAGFVARRIVNLMHPNSNVLKGQKLGFIKFGSRVEIIVPKNFELRVKKGMKVKGCRTVIGKFN